MMTLDERWPLHPGRYKNDIDRYGLWQYIRNENDRVNSYRTNTTVFKRWVFRWDCHGVKRDDR